MSSHSTEAAASFSREQLLASARLVLIAESAALTELASTLGDVFVEAVRLLVDCKGRVVVSGMGKSGHVARKMASTLASTGTPALFVHPGEASHGDLGMIVPDDCIIALSNSGETAELSDLVAYSRRFSIPLIAITSGETSILASAADATLLFTASGRGLSDGSRTHDLHNDDARLRRCFGRCGS